MTFTKLFVTPLICLGLAGPALAADFSDPTWPCVQRKVERLSLGLMWVHPVPETLPEDAEVRRDIEDLGERLALRKLEVDVLEPEIAAFAEKYDGDPAILGHAFADAFGSLTTRRSRIIDGIGDFSLSQISLTERIEGLRAEMTTEMDKTSPDFDRIDELEEQLDWGQLIYSDRQKSITYLCETPVLLERRLYSIAQMMQAHVRKE